MMKQRRWLAVAAMMMLVFLVVSCSDDDEDDPSGRATRESSEARFETEWVLSERLPVGGGGLAANDDVVVAVGWDWERDRGALATLYSHDGLEWEPGEGFPEVEEFGPSAAVAGSVNGFVAVATRNGSVPNRPVVAFSSDGSDWEDVDVQDLPASEVSWLSDVVAGPDGFVIVADVEEGAVAWFSTDGRTWAETDLPAVDGQVTVATNGSEWMAVGGELEFEGDVGPALIFTSVDGLRWSEVENRTPLPAAAVPFYAGAAPLAALGDTWVLAPGEGGSGAATSWVSTDGGETWEETVMGEHLWSVQDLAATDQGFVIAARQAPPSGAREDHFLLFSQTGADWHANQSIADYTSIASLDDHLVVLDTDGNIFLWRGSLAPT